MCNIHLLVWLAYALIKHVCLFRNLFNLFYMQFLQGSKLSKLESFFPPFEELLIHQEVHSQSEESDNLLVPVAMLTLKHLLC